MNNYITLDGKKYYTPFGGWSPAMINKPSTVELTSDGSIDVTYGPASFYSWEGEIEGPVTSPGTGWGTVSDLKTTIAKRQTVKFYDHYGVTEYDVHIIGPFSERSYSPKWDSASNIMIITVSLVEA